MIKAILFFSFFSLWGFAQPHSGEACVAELEISGTIGPATVEFLKEGLVQAKAWNCGSLLLKINTPGGSLPSTRFIVEDILNSELPVLCLVAPSGGHAGSAGAIILQACHVSGALPATNIGAATPILSLGQEMPKDLRNKIINDTQSWVEGLTKLRGRSQEFGRDIVSKAKAVEAHEAAKIGGIDFVAQSVEEFLQKARGRATEVAGNKNIKVEIGERRPIERNLKFRVLEIITDPEFAYLIFMASLGLLYFELTHPGTIAPGVIGAIGIIISLISFHKLNVQWAGLALLILGVVLMIAEAFVPSFGALGLGGIVAFVLGSLFLFDPIQSGFVLPMSSILPVALVLGLIMLALATLAFRTRKLKRLGGFDDLMEKSGKIIHIEDGESTVGQVEVQGEIWKFQSNEKLKINDEVLVIGHQGLKLLVRKKESS